MAGCTPLTGQGRSQYSSLQPGEQAQVPLTGSQAAALEHWHVWLQLGPQVPLEQGREQSTPCQPGRGHSPKDTDGSKERQSSQLALMDF